MSTCENCGAEIVDGMIFCKKCGAPARPESTDICDESEKLQKMSLEVREACDRLLACYVTGITSMRLSIDAIQDNSAAQISALTEELRLANEKLCQMQSELAALQSENVRLTAENQDLQNINLALTEHLQSTTAETTSEDGICPNCGEAVEANMLFCGNCGCKLK